MDSTEEAACVSLAGGGQGLGMPTPWVPEGTYCTTPAPCPSSEACCWECSEVPRKLCCLTHPAPYGQCQARWPHPLPSRRGSLQVASQVSKASSPLTDSTEDSRRGDKPLSPLRPALLAAHCGTVSQALCLWGGTRVCRACLAELAV